MNILSSIAVSLTAEQVSRSMDGQTQSSSFTGGIDTAIRRAEPLIQAVAACRWMTVSAIGPGCLKIYSDTTREVITIKTGRRTDLWRFAERILVSVITIGPHLDEAVRTLTRSRDLFGAYLLDCAGLAALWQAFAAVCSRAEKEARARNMGLGHLAGPGGVAGWPLDSQITVCSLLPLEDIGVKVDELGVLHPLKSVSGLIPMGRNYKRETVGPACRYCQCRPTCHQRLQEREKTMG